MSYTPTNWINGEEGHQTPINASNLNKMENGITDNSSDIAALQGGMRFIGETSTLPQNPTIGDVYQASIANISSLHNKEGDLLVYISGNTWHVIPSGDEHDGTVTEITQGAGIIVNEGSSLTKTGEIRLDTSYTANDTRNGLMSNEHFHKLSTLSNISVTGSWADLDQSTIPISAKRQIRSDLDTDSVENPSQTVVSQQGLKTLFAGKSDVSHTHLIEEISGEDRAGGTVNPLSYYLAKENDGIEDELVEASPKIHSHGNLTSGGYLQKQVDESTVYAKDTILGTDSDGKIINKDTLPSSIIRGYTFYNSEGTASISLSDLQSAVGSTSSDGLRGAVANLNTLVGTTASNGLRKTVSDLGGSVSSLLSWVGSTADKGLRKTVSSHTNSIKSLHFKTNGGESDNVNRMELTVPANGTLSSEEKLTRPAAPDSISSTHEYYPLAIRGWNFSNRKNSGKTAPNGRNCTMCTIYGLWLTKKSEGKSTDGWYVHADVKNFATTSAIIYLTVYVTWKTTTKS